MERASAESDDHGGWYSITDFVGGTADTRHGRIMKYDPQSFAT
jgi:hypothetical protein